MAYSKMLIAAVQRTWQAIGHDLIEASEACDEPLDNESVVEGCFDADHIVTYGGSNGQAAQLEFRARIAEIGYRPALLEVVKQLPYPLV